MNKTIEAARSNDVYYDPEEVKIEQGYSERDGSPYTLVTIKARDKAGRPILVQQVPAYNNTTNSGLTQSIEDVSYLTSAQVIMTATQDAKWKGTAMIGGNPINTDMSGIVPGGQDKILGIRWDGSLGVFDASTEVNVLKQNGVVNSIGLISPLIVNDVIDENAQSNVYKSAMTVIGWKPTGDRVFLIAGNFDTPGCSPSAIAEILKNSGVTTAVITSTVNPGLEFMGKMPAAPTDWKIPTNSMYFVVTKRPFPCGWRNDWMGEVANTIQNLGRIGNDISSITHRLDSHDEKFNEVDDKIAEIEADIDRVEQDLNEKITAEKDRAEAEEARLDKKIDDEVEKEKNRAEAAEQAEETRATEQEAALQTKIEQETSRAEATEQAEQKRATQAEDNLQSLIEQENRRATQQEANLSARITAETTRATKAETDEANRAKTAEQNIQKQLDREVEERTAADSNIQNALNAERTARETKDTALDTRIDAAINQFNQEFEQAEAELPDKIAEKVDSMAKSGLIDIPVATTERVGTVQVGTGLKVTVDGVLSVDQSTLPKPEVPVASQSVLGGIKQGTNINIEEDGTLNLKIASASELGLIKVGQNLTIAEDGTLNASGGESEGITEEQARNIAQQEAGKVQTTLEGQISQDKTENDQKYLNKETGGTVTGQLKLGHEPTENDDAATKKYVDDKKAESDASISTLTEQYTTLNETVDQIGKTQGSEQTKLDDFTNDLASVKQKDTTQDAKIETLETEQSSLDARIESAENTLNDIPNKYVKLTGESEQVIEGAIQAGNGIKMNNGVLELPVGGSIRQSTTGNRIVPNIEGQHAMVTNSTGSAKVPIEVGTPTDNDDATTKKYVDDQLKGKLDLTGGTMTGDITMMPGKTIKGVPVPEGDTDAVNKKYVDSKIEPISNNTRFKYLGRFDNLSISDISFTINSGSRIGFIPVAIFLISGDPVYFESPVSNKIINNISIRLVVSTNTPHPIVLDDSGRNNDQIKFNCQITDNTITVTQVDSSSKNFILIYDLVEIQ
ncbi:hypothetical protein [uncultured Rikenella sp.]|uniref:hypothetical protein n=1 Tax=uncultured Rikenella sp. TaxID=368003 RepID=UPI00260C7FAA|nr:hypothetical protein [uncultured Rikenella sp.]